MCALLILCVGNVQAIWYESTGSAPIQRGNTDLARQEAVRNAVKDALLFAGATVKSAQQVTNGLLTQDTFEVRASGVVNDIQLIDEKKQGNHLYVSIRADIFADERQCFTTQYRKSVAFLPLRIQHSSHTKVGSVYQLPQMISEQLFHRVSTTTTHIDPRVFLPSQIKMKEGMNNNNLRHELAQVSKQSESQYIISGLIKDMSMTERPEAKWKSIFSADPERFFDLQLYIYDGYTGQQIQILDYSTQAEWPFDTRQMTDVSSRRFWQSDYGQAITEQLVKATGEIDSILKCQPAHGKIIESTGDTIRINLGHSNNIQVGDKFKISHQANFVDEDGNDHPQYVITDYEIVVTDAYSNTAVGKSPTMQLLGNVQVGDIVKQID